MDLLLQLVGVMQFTLSCCELGFIVIYAFFGVTFSAQKPIHVK